MEFFCENSERLLFVNYFHKNALLYVFDIVLNTLNVVV